MPEIQAQLSTGPRTHEGKAVSSQNAFAHGLTSAKLVLPWENEAEFNNLLKDLIAEHKPATATEGILVREMAEQYWRLQRARNREYKLLSEASRRPDIDEEKAILLAQRYATRHERAFHKCLSTLRSLQKERRKAEAEAAAESEAKLTQPAPAPTQFVLQNAVSSLPTLLPATPSPALDRTQSAA